MILDIIIGLLVIPAPSIVISFIIDLTCGYTLNLRGLLLFIGNLVLTGILIKCFETDRPACEIIMASNYILRISCILALFINGIAVFYGIVSPSK